jgi:hypothetical protein
MLKAYLSNMIGKNNQKSPVPTLYSTSKYQNIYYKKNGRRLKKRLLSNAFKSQKNALERAHFGQFSPVR